MTTTEFMKPQLPAKYFGYETTPRMREQRMEFAAYQHEVEMRRRT